MDCLLVLLDIEWRLLGREATGVRQTAPPETTLANGRDLGQENASGSSSPLTEYTFKNNREDVK
jgi:hypothetical protein